MSEVKHETRRLFRFHRGGLHESMDTKVEFTDKASLAKIISDAWDTEVKPEELQVTYYVFDERIGWHSHIVTLHGRHTGVAGFTSCPVAD